MLIHPLSTALQLQSPKRIFPSVLQTRVIPRADVAAAGLQPLVSVVVLAALVAALGRQAARALAEVPVAQESALRAEITIILDTKQI